MDNGDMDGVRVLAAGIGFTEGPVWSAEGRLMVTSMSRGLVYEVDLDGAGVLGEIETGGGPNGLTQDDCGIWWVAQNGAAIVPSRSSRSVAPGLQSVQDGVVTDRVVGLLAPNDLVQGPDGRMWFTDPNPPEAGDPGHVHAYEPATGSLSTMAAGIDYPNGLVFDVSGRVLFVAETGTGRILRFAWDGRVLEPDGVFATMPAGGPDGLALAPDGALWAAGPDADLLAVFDPDGTVRSTVRFDEPTFPTNVCCAGRDDGVLVVTAARGGRVLALDPTTAEGR